jgi:hypothetical protein
LQEKRNGTYGKEKVLYKLNKMSGMDESLSLMARFYVFFSSGGKSNKIQFWIIKTSFGPIL